MKMTKQHFDGLSKLVTETLAQRGLSVADVQKQYADAGLSDTRRRFDCLYAIPFADRQAWFDTGVYDYLDDSHIETALKRIVG